ncbi:hypothetical protein [Salinigranum sp. GCM10025319]|uniref:hypothetical protein n=1 Tax=Salinigranum sp. GCM10025319 TaxID=3252687 RepID=UPI003614BC71
MSFPGTPTNDAALQRSRTDRPVSSARAFASTPPGPFAHDPWTVARHRRGDVAVAGAAKPMQTDREWLWLVGLLGILIGSVLLGLAVDTGPVRNEPVAFYVTDDEPISGVTVRVDRVTDDGVRSVRRMQVDEGVEVQVFTTRNSGAYTVELASDGVACERTVTVRERDGTLGANVRRPADGGECPVGFYVE